MTSAFTHPHQVGLTRVLIVLGLHHLQGQKDQINEVAFSHSGEYLFVPTGAGAVATYRLDLQGDTVSLKEFYRCEPHACVINCMGRSSISFLYSRSPSLVRPMLSLTHLTPPPMHCQIRIPGAGTSHSFQRRWACSLRMSLSIRYIAVGAADSIVSLIDLEEFYCVNTFAHLESVAFFG